MFSYLISLTHRITRPGSKNQSPLTIISPCHSHRQQIKAALSNEEDDLPSASLMKALYNGTLSTKN